MTKRATVSENVPKLSTAEIAALEARNALLQFDLMIQVIKSGITAGAAFQLRPDTLIELNRTAVKGVDPHGSFREGEVRINNSSHQPPSSDQVPGLVDQMIEYTNNELADARPISVSAYLMWRVNWIHPFWNGNGRTSRAVSYAMLSIRAGAVLPGAVTIPELIVADKTPYYEALDSADAAWERGVLDVSTMERYLSELLKQQLQS